MTDNYTQLEQPQSNRRILNIELPSLGKLIHLEVASGSRYLVLLQKQRQFKLNQSKQDKTDEETYEEHKSQCKIIAEFSNLEYEEAVNLLAPYEVLFLYLSIQGDLQALGELTQLMKR